MSLDRNEADSDDVNVYKVLEHRARFVRRTNIALIILLILAATLVATLIVGYKDNQKNWITNVIDASLIKRGHLNVGDLVFFRTAKSDDDNDRKVGIYLGDNAQANLWNNLDSQKVEALRSMHKNLSNTPKSQSEKIADSIAIVLLTVSLIIFVGFIMRAVLVFIRYYMQLGTDFENQRLAYILSKKEGVDFSKVLQDLRDNNINFERTPQLPQEKIILNLIDVLKKNGYPGDGSSKKD